MSKRHEERARKLHARLTASMRAANGNRKHSVEDVTRLEVTASEKGGIAVSFRYSDGTESEIDFAPDANAYGMAREAKRHAVGHCSEIREARHFDKLAAERAKNREAERAARAAAFEERVAALPDGATLTGDDADDALEYVQEQIEARGGDAVHQAMTEPGNAAASRRADDVRRAAREYAARRAAEEDDELRAMLKARIVEALALHHADNPRAVSRDGAFSGAISCDACDFEAFEPDGFDMGSKDSALLRQFAEHQADVVLGLL